MNKIYFKYYLKLIIKNKITIILFLLVNIMGLTLNSIIGGNQVKNYTFIFILPSLIWMVISPMIFSIELYSKSKINGTELIFASKPIQRRTTIILRTLVMFLTTFFSSLILTSLIIAPVLIRVKDFELFALLWISVMLSSVLIIMFSTVLFSLICSSLPLIPAIIASLLLAILFSFGSLGTRAIIKNDNHNVLSWESKNTIKYAKMLKVNSNGKIIKQYNVISTGAQSNKNNIKGNDSINKVNPLYNWLNPGAWIVNPISTIFSNVYTVRQEDYLIHSKDSYKFGLEKISDEFIDDSSQIPMKMKNQKWVFISNQDFNPFLQSKDKIVDKIVEISNCFSNKYRGQSLFDDENFDIWINKIKKDKIWKNLNLSKQEKEVLRYWTGTNEHTHLLMYLMNYHSVIKHKLNNLKTILQKRHVPDSHIKIMEFIFNSDIANKNVLEMHALNEPGFIKENFPFLKYQNLKKEATFNDVQNMKELIRFNKNSQTTRILLENNSMIDVNLKSIDSAFGNILSDKDWEQFIDANNELGTLKNIYKKIKRYLMNNQVKVKEIKFNDNSLDIYKMDGYYKIQTIPFNYTYGLTTLLMLFGTLLMFLILIKTYKNKDIS